MESKKTWPAPLRQKLFLTAIIGIAVLLVGTVTCILLKDQTILLLSVILCAMCIGKTITVYRIICKETYEVIEGVCVSVSSNPLQRFRRISIMDCNGNQSALLLHKQSKIRIGYQYRFYFGDTRSLRIANSFLDAALASDHFLGFEEIGKFEDALQGHPDVPSPLSEP